MQASHPPPLVLVHGAPATGKSTLARHVATALRLPLLSRDALKEAMADRVSFESLAESERFGLAYVPDLDAVVAFARAATGGHCDEAGGTAYLADGAVKGSAHQPRRMEA